MSAPKFNILRVNTRMFYITIDGKAVGPGVYSFSQAQMILDWLTLAYEDVTGERSQEHGS